jgi:hypothetical protein
MAEHSNLYVSNLAPEVDDATLAEAFGTCGGVVSACVWRDQNTKQRCAASALRAGEGCPHTHCWRRVALCAAAR